MLAFIKLCLFFAQDVYAQDIHFSQFLSAPMNLNPAHTGYFEGNLRAVANYRRQWNSITIPYQTFGLSIDTKGLPQIKNTAFGLGVYNDQTGDSKLNTFSGTIALAQTIPFNKKSTQGITLGVHLGITQRSINYSGLRFDSQYDGSAHNPNLSSNEDLSMQRIIYPNVHLGIAWFKHLSNRKKLNIGTAVYHINRPNQSFFSANSSPLDPRINLHGSFQTPISKNIDFLPAMLFNLQGTYTAITFGGSLKYILNHNPSYYRAVYLGFWNRAGDAGWFSLGMDYGNFYGCISYDINYSPLVDASNLRGGVEVSLIYIIKNFLPKRKKYLSCPDFL
ncbi:MAG: type IX secretion system membrane protein PorP/SprF [Cytophagales bacterium]|nr:MAG: type IX secretion system membrane protein PorP/SprF [Cytophagales bacterium]